MTATAFIESIQSLTFLLPNQISQFISLAPHLTNQERADAFARAKKANKDIRADVKEYTNILDMATKAANAIYKKEWPKVKKSVHDEERKAAERMLDDQISDA